MESGNKARYKHVGSLGLAELEQLRVESNGEGSQHLDNCNLSLTSTWPCHRTAATFTFIHCSGVFTTCVST